MLFSDSLYGEDNTYSFISYNTTSDFLYNAELLLQQFLASMIVQYNVIVRHEEDEENEEKKDSNKNREKEDEEDSSTQHHGNLN
jgi:hypothetical protein